MKTTQGLDGATRKSRHRRRWGAVAIAAAVMALSSCTLDFSDGKLRVVCYESDYDHIRDNSTGGDDYYRAKYPIGCQSLYGPFGGPINEWPLCYTIWPEPSGPSCT